MEIQQVIERARGGKFEPVHILVGAEHFLVERAIKLLRQASLGESPPGFNDDVYHADTANTRAVVSTAKTLPMMAQARFVLLRDIDSLDKEGSDVIAAYIDAPSPSTCFVGTAEKLDLRSRIAKVAKDRGYIADAPALRAAGARGFAVSEAKARGHRLEPDAADLLIDSAGLDLSAIDDALERLSLYVGAGAAIDEAAVEACIARVRVESIWALVDAVSARKTEVALRSAASLLSSREHPLRILSLVARQLRIVARMRDALASGLRGPEAAKAAGAPPFKASELTEAAKRFDARDIREAFRVVADADVALKSSKRPGETILEEAIVRLCAGRPRQASRPSP